MHQIFQSFLKDLESHSSKGCTTERQEYHSNCWKTCKAITTAVDKLKIAEVCLDKSYYLPIEDHEVPSHIEFHIENYIIRSRSIYDRVLIFTNYLLNIQLAPSRVTHDLIITNSKVEKVKIKSKLKEINKACGTYRDVRNEIIHQHSYENKKLEWLDVAQKAILITDGDYEKFNLSKEKLAYITADIIKSHLIEFHKNRENIEDKINNFLDSAKEIYDQRA